MLSTWYGDLAATLLAGSAKGVKSLIVLVYWTVWCKHNRRIFDGMERTVGQVVAAVQSEARQWIQAGASGLEVVTQRFIE
jgi:predicted alpha/beta hydrolase